MNPGVLSAVIILLLLVVCLVGWTGYAYFNPQTTSGQLLIQVAHILPVFLRIFEPCSQDTLRIYIFSFYKLSFKFVYIFFKNSAEQNDHHFNTFVCYSHFPFTYIMDNDKEKITLGQFTKKVSSYCRKIPIVKIKNIKSTLNSMSYFLYESIFLMRETRVCII